MKFCRQLYFFSIFLLTFLITGCLLPFPHTRIIRPTLNGSVSNSINGKPIVNATVVVVYDDGINIIAHTNTSGCWTIPGEKSWHAAVFAAPPTAISLFPYFGLDYGHFPCKITIKAEGYEKWQWPSWKNEDAIDTLLIPIREPTKISPLKKL